jgi:hypothetical protein
MNTFQTIINNRIQQGKNNTIPSVFFEISLLIPLNNKNRQKGSVVFNPVFCIPVQIPKKDAILFLLFVSKKSDLFHCVRVIIHQTISN